MGFLSENGIMALFLFIGGSAVVMFVAVREKVMVGKKHPFSGFTAKLFWYILIFPLILT